MVEYLRSKDPFFSISTDIIVWYSWETDEMFQDTVKAVRELEIDLFILLDILLEIEQLHQKFILMM